MTHAAPGPAPGPAAPTPALRRALVVLTAIRLVVNTMERFVYPVLPAIARGLGIPLDRAGLLIGVRAAASLVVPAVVATVGRHGRRRRQMTFALCLTALGSLVVIGPWGFGVVVLGWVLIGIGKPSYDVGAQAYLADRTPYASRARVLGWMELTYAGGLLVGAPAAGWLIARWDWRAPFLVIAVLALASVPVLRRVVEPGHPDGGDEPRPLALRRRDVAFLAAVGTFMVGTETTLVVMGAWLEDDFGLSLLALGGVAAVLGLAELAGEGVVLAVADRLGKRVMAMAGLGLGAAGFVLVAVAGHTTASGLATLALALFGFEVAIVAAIPLASELQPGARAQFLALLGVAVLGGRAIGDVVGPRLYLAEGIDAVATVTVLTYVTAITVLWRGVDDDRTHHLTGGGDTR